MGLFGGSKSKSTSTTTNQTSTQTLSLGDLSHGNAQAGNDLTINGFFGEDLQAYLENVGNLASKVITSTTETADKATSSNSSLAGSAIAEVARGYQSAYSETSGIIQVLRPVLMVGVGTLALLYGSKFLKRL